MAEILFVRHGQTQSNVDSLLHGRTDVELTRVGELQARRVARRLAKVEHIQYLYSSPLRRAWKTAEIVGAHIGLWPRMQPELTEFDFGDFEGLTLAIIQQEHPEIFGRILDLKDVDFGFPRGESRREFHLRVSLAMRELIERHRRERIVVVAHGGVIGSAIAQLTGEDPNNWAMNQVANCSLTHVEIGWRTPVLVHCWNDVAHLGEVGQF